MKTRFMRHCSVALVGVAISTANFGREIPFIPQTPACLEGGLSSCSESIVTEENFLAELRNMDSGSRLKAIAAWQSFSPMPPLNRLIAMTDDPNHPYRNIAAVSLTRLNPVPTEAYPSLCRAVETGREEAPVIMSLLAKRPRDCGVSTLVKSLGRSPITVKYLNGDAIVTVGIDFARHAEDALRTVGKPAVPLLITELDQVHDQKHRARIVRVLQTVLNDHPDFPLNGKELDSLTELLVKRNVTDRSNTISLLERIYRKQPLPEQLAEWIAKTYLSIPDGEPPREASQSHALFFTNASHINEELLAVRMLGASSSPLVAETLVNWACSGRRLEEGRVTTWSPGSDVKLAGNLDAIVESLQKIGSPAIPVLLKTMTGSCNRYAARDLETVLVMADLSGADVKTMAILITNASNNPFMLFSLRYLRPYPPELLSALHKAARNDDERINSRLSDALALLYRDVVASTDTSAEADIPLIESTTKNLNNQVSKLRSDNEQIRRSTAEFFEILGLPLPEVVEALIDTLGDKSDVVKIAAANALGKMRATASVPALQAAAKDKSVALANAAEQALKRIRPSQ